MTSSLLPYVIAAILSAENSGQYAISRHGERGGLQIKQVMIDEVYRTSGIRYDIAAAYSEEGRYNICESYLTTWSRRINGRTYTLADLSAGDCGVLWSCGPGGLDRRLGRKPGLYAAKVQLAFDAQVQRVAER